MGNDKTNLYFGGFFDDVMAKYANGERLCDNCIKWFKPDDDCFVSKNGKGIIVCTEDPIEGRVHKMTFTCLCKECSSKFFPNTKDIIRWMEVH